MEVAGFIVFNRLYLPCFSNYKINLRLWEADLFGYLDADLSETAELDCSESIFQKSVQLGEDTSKGNYKLFGIVTPNKTVDDQRTDDVSVYDVYDIYSNEGSNSATSDKAIVLNSVINTQW